MSLQSLDTIVSVYKKSLLDKSETNNPELEIRYQNVDDVMFNTVYQYYMNNTDSSNIFITQIVSSSVERKTDTNQNQKTINIKNIFFENKKQKNQLLLSKTRIGHPYKHEHNMYSVVLSIEKLHIGKFISDEKATIRVKNRISFIVIENKIKWRIDMTVVKQMSGSNLESTLKPVVDNMIKSCDITPTTFLSCLKRGGLYKYEIEAELLEHNDLNTVVITSADILHMAQKILYIANPKYLSDITLQRKIYEVAKYICQTEQSLKPYQDKARLKQLLPKVQALTRCDYRNIYPLIDYFVTDKTDGVRAIGMVDKSHGYIITDKLHIYERTIPEKMNMITIVDSEYYEDTLYVFDVIVYNNVNYSQSGFEIRVTILADAVEALKQVGIKAEAKPYIHISDNIKESVLEIYNRKRSYEIDGLIFVKPGNNYLLTESYKWKDTENNTIDFLVKKVPKSLLGKYPFLPKDNYTMYILFVGISNNTFQSLGLHKIPSYEIIFNGINTNKDYFPIQFCPSNAPLAYIYYHPNTNKMDIENNIVEFKCVKNCAGDEGYLVEWEPIKIRSDRQKDLETNTYYGNDYRVAEITWINYLDPLPLEQLWLNISEDYFMTSKSDMYYAQTSVLSYIKTYRISQYSHCNWIIDIGSGKGQDLGRYFNAKVKNLIAIDNDKASLSELIRRKFNFIYKNNSTNVFVILADMKLPYTALLSKINTIKNLATKANYVICNLSIHYYIYNEELLNNFINLINNVLEKDGKLVITCFFGKYVFDKLKDIKEGDTWTIYENEVKKYSIKKMYSSDKLELFGQKIGVILPFSKGEYYEEYLVNTDNLINEFIKHGYKKEVDDNIQEKTIRDFRLLNPSVAAQLSPDDKTYLSLYGEIVLKRIAEI